MFRIDRFPAVWFTLGLLLFAPTNVDGATPDEELLRLTPRDSSMVLLIKNVREHSARLLESPFARALSSSKLGQAFATTPEFAQIEQVGRQLAAALQVDWNKVRDELIGDAVVLSYRSPHPAKNEAERGLIITWVRDAKFAEQLRIRLDQIQKESGELKEIRKQSHKGVDYLRRIKANDADEFVLQHNQVLALSSQESAITQVIEKILKGDADSQSLVREFDALNCRDALAALWVNPRSFDEELDAKVKGAIESEAAFLSTFSKAWKGLSGAALTLRLDRHAELQLTLATDPKLMPTALLNLARGLGQPSALSMVAPDDSLLALAVRIDAPALLDTLMSLMTAESWTKQSAPLEAGLTQILGKKFAAELSRRLGPDIGIFVTPPRSADAVLPDVAFVVRIQRSADGEFERVLRDGADALAALARLDLNAKHDKPVRVESKQGSTFEVKYLVHDKAFPPGWKPAYAFAHGFLVVATNPDAILRLDWSKANKSPTDSGRLLEVHLQRVSRYLQSRRDALSELSKAGDGNNELKSLLERFHMLAELVERIELTNESSKAGELRVSLRVFPLMPLNK